MALTDHPANGVNSSDVGQVPSKEKVPLPVCDTCKQQARSVDRFSKDQSILKWTKCDPNKDKGGWRARGYCVCIMGTFIFKSWRQSFCETSWEPIEVTPQESFSKDMSDMRLRWFDLWFYDDDLVTNLYEMSETSIQKKCGKHILFVHLKSKPSIKHTVLTTFL